MAAGVVNLEAETLEHQTALAALEPEWQALASACPTATVFQTYEWNASWWRHFGEQPGRRLCVLAFRDPQGVLVGLAPLMTSFWYATPLRRLSFLGTGTSDYLDLLAAPGWESQVGQKLYETLEQQGGWQIADWQQLREGSLLRNLLPTLDSKLVWLDALQEPCPYLPLPSDWAALTQTLGKKTRSNIGYYDRALHKVYDVEIGPVQRVKDLPEALTTLFELHQRRWNQRWLPGVFAGKRVQNFHRDVAARLLKQDWLRLFELKLDGETQACLYCFAYGDRICYYQGGFEPDLAKLSLGTVLTARAMQTAINEGRAVFDFLRGDEPYKAKWTQSAHVNLRRLITRRRTGLAPLIRQVQHIEENVEHRAKAWMRRMGTHSRPGAAAPDLPNGEESKEK